MDEALISQSVSPVSFNSSKHLVYYHFCLEDRVLWFLFILVSEIQSAPMVAYEKL